MVLICISLLVNDAEYLFMCLFGKMSIQILCLFFNWIVCLFCYCMSCMSSLCILDINVFSHPTGYLFILLMAPLL